MAKGKEFLTNIIIGGKVSPSLAKAINKANEQSNVLKKIGNAGKAIGKATLAASAAAAAGIVAISKSAVESYAEYEQLVGGVDTLFKESSKTVQQYADNAYKTAGISANEYMSTVTSFSASLLQSLGGNTKQAAEYANRAIIDMSDNANKMGTDMSVIQNTYQSLAKGNYAMLDNLKLGYGGTKTEMQRLIKEAAAMKGVQAELGITVDANSLSFANMVNAISVVQKNMGITGTTAKEASTTIQGSISSMRAAWTNLLTGLGNENADFDALLTNFLDSVGTVAQNLLPRISIVIGKIPDLVRGLLPLIPPLIAELLPVAIEGVSSIIAGVGAILPELISTVVSSIGQIITQSFAQMPVPLQILAGAIAAITAGIAAYNAVVAIKNVVDKIQEKGIKKIAMAQLAQNAAFLMSPIFWIVAGIVALIAIFAVLWNKCEGFRNFWIGLWDGIKAAFSAVINWFKENWKTLILFMMNPIAGLFKYFYDHFEGFRKVVDKVINGIKGAFDKIKNFFTGGKNETTVKAYATGGTVTRPHLAIVGDAPETIVPHGNTPRNRALLAEAARGVGGGIGSNVSITFAPVIYGGSGADVRQAINDSEAEFERKMDAYFARKGRVSFA